MNTSNTAGSRGLFSPALVRGTVLTFAALVLAAPEAFAQSALEPLPRCDANSRSFYLMRYFNPVAPAGTPPTVTLERATIPASGAVARSPIWSGLGAAPVSAREIARAPATVPLPAGASVAGGMGKDGFIYAMRAVDGDNDWDNSPAAGWLSAQGGGWRSHTRQYEMLRYGRNGVQNLGMVQGLGTYWTDPTNGATQVNGAPLGTSPESYLDLRLGPNFNAADIDPVSGIMYVGNLRSGMLNKLFRIDITQTPPAFVGTVTLTSNIPGEQSGDFAIDATGTYAYGVAYNGTTRTSLSYRITLATGAVTTLGNPGAGILGPGYFPYGGGARAADGSFVFYGGGTLGPVSIFNTYQLNTASGALTDGRTTAAADSADAASCLPKLVATLQCTPASLVDAADNVSTCTVTLDQPAPAGGLAVALTPPAANGRYSTTCGNSTTVPAGATSATCTISATPNTVPGDGFVDATVQLATPADAADYVLGTPTSATVRIDNDDVLLPTAQLVCTPPVLTDAPAQVSTCTVSLSAPAPTGGLSIGLTPPAANPRYSSTCVSPLAVAAGASSASCTVTATPNTVPGDGSVVAGIALLPGTGYILDSELAQAQVTVENDDGAAALTPVPTLGVWGLMLMSLGLGGLGWRQRRRARG